MATEVLDTPLEGYTEDTEKSKKTAIDLESLCALCS
jgi:hypothetical protein